MHIGIIKIWIPLFSFLVATISAEDLIVRQEVDFEREEVLEWMTSVANVEAAGEVNGFANIDLQKMWKHASESLVMRDGSVTFLRTPTFVKGLDGRDPLSPETPNLNFRKIEIINFFTMAENSEASKFNSKRFLVVFSFSESAGNYTAEVIFLHNGVVIKSRRRPFSDHDRLLIENAKKASAIHLKEIENFIGREIETSK